MRRRLVLGAIAVVTLALLLFAVPLAVVLRQQVVRSGLDGFAATLEQTATLVDERSRTCAEVQATLTALARDDVAVTVFDREGRARFASSAAADGAGVRAAQDVLATAIDGATGSALVDGDRVVAVPLSTPVCGERLVLQAVADGGELRARVRGALGLLAIAGVVAIVAGAVVAQGIGVRLARPLERLAASARRLGDGDFSERAPRAGLPEPDNIADALDQTADRLGRAVARGTAFAADASHQLRTPLTALRLHLESAAVDLAAESERRDAVDGALAELDRLTATIEELVELTQLDEVEHDVDLGGLVVERAPDWARRAEEEGRAVVTDLAAAPPARVRPAAIVQAVDVLVDNALQHGRGTVTVSVRGAGGTDDLVRIAVADEGPGLPDGLDDAVSRADRGALPVRGGRGLVLARDLVEGERGRLALRSGPDGTVAELLVPVRPRGGRASGRAD